MRIFRTSLNHLTSSLTWAHLWPQHLHSREETKPRETAGTGAGAGPSPIRSTPGVTEPQRRSPTGGTREGLLSPPPAPRGALRPAAPAAAAPRQAPAPHDRRLRTFRPPAALRSRGGSCHSRSRAAARRLASALPGPGDSTTAAAPGWGPPRPPPCGPVPPLGARPPPAGRARRGSPPARGSPGSPRTASGPPPRTAPARTWRRRRRRRLPPREGDGGSAPAAVKRRAAGRRC